MGFKVFLDYTVIHTVGHSHRAFGRPKICQKRMTPMTHFSSDRFQSVKAFSPPELFTGIWVDRFLQGAFTFGAL